MHCAKPCPNAKETAISPHAPAPTSAPALPHILVAEDDPTSGYFFKAALEQWNCRALIQRDGAAALAQARTHRFDLLLLDCRMPGMGAVELLSNLRDQPQAASRATPAVATSAESDTTQRYSLQKAGFVDLLLKPVSLQTLHDAISPLLHDHDSGPDGNTPLLDDTQALKNSGNMTAVHALRDLFVQELERLLDELDALNAQPPQLAERLHRLLASCGFCGATALASATRRMKRHLDSTPPPTAADELDRFRSTLEATVHNLHQMH